METKIVVEKQVENKVYFEVLPVDEAYSELLKFGIEKLADIKDAEQMKEIRQEVLNLASTEFERLKETKAL